MQAWSCTPQIAIEQALLFPKYNITPSSPSSPSLVSYSCNQRIWKLKWISDVVLNGQNKPSQCKPSLSTPSRTPSWARGVLSHVAKVRPFSRPLFETGLRSRMPRFRPFWRGHSRFSSPCGVRRCRTDSGDWLLLKAEVWAGWNVRWDEMRRNIKREREKENGEGDNWALIKGVDRREVQGLAPRFDSGWSTPVKSAMSYKTGKIKRKSRYP